jgi:outer membrane murein-binding lipoprotein Lpp
MKRFFIVALSSLLLGCGIPKAKHEAALSKIKELEAELDTYRYGQERIVALIQQAFLKKDINAAKEYIQSLAKYHPQAMNSAEVKTIISNIEKEEKRKEEDELKSRHGFEDSNAATAQILNVAEASFLSDAKKLTAGVYYIIRPGTGTPQDGATFFMYSPDNKYNIFLHTDKLYKWLDRGVSIAVLAKYEPAGLSPLYAVEIIRIK